MKLISLNVYRMWFRERSEAFLKGHPADVILLTEIDKQDVAPLAQMLGMHAEFALMGKNVHRGCTEETEFGVALLSRELLTNPQIHEYAPVFGPELEEDYHQVRCVLLTAETIVDGKTYRVGVTHGMWTREGSVTPAQTDAFTKLLAALKTYDQIIFGGDFNAPRGMGSYERLSAVYKEAVPASVESTIDPELHRVPTLRLMVDSIFYTPQYTCTDFDLIGGASDHYALVADIT